MAMTALIFSTMSHADGQVIMMIIFPTILGRFQPSATVHPTHIGRAYGYLPRTVFYIFSQEI